MLATQEFKFSFDGAAPPAQKVSASVQDSVIPVAKAGSASRASVEELLTTMQTENTQAGNAAALDSMIRQRVAQLSNGKTLTPKQKQVIEDGASGAFKISTETVSWEKMKPIFIKSYQENFSQEEVDSMTAFYKSPAGQAMVMKQPIVQQEILKSLMPTMTAMTEKLKAYMAELGATINAEK